MSPKENRRVKATKRIIQNTLVELMQRYPFSKISVKMICSAADVNRSTFYAHYEDKEALLEQIQQDAVNGIKEYIVDTAFTRDAQKAVPTIVEVLQYCRVNQELFKMLLSRPENTTFQQELMALVQEKTIAEICEEERLDPRTSKYLDLFVISGVMSVIRCWLVDGCPESPAEIANILTQLLYDGTIGTYQK